MHAGNWIIREGPMTDYTIGIDTIEKMIEKMQAKPWPIYKIKLGTASDAEIIRALRKHTDAILRVDANSGWSLQQALESDSGTCTNAALNLSNNRWIKQIWMVCACFLKNLPYR